MIDDLVGEAPPEYTPSRGGGWVNGENPGGGMACTKARNENVTVG